MKVYECAVCEIKRDIVRAELFNVLEENPTIEVAEFNKSDFNPSVGIGSIFYWLDGEGKKKSKIIVDCTMNTQEDIIKLQKEASAMWKKLNF